MGREKITRYYLIILILQVAVIFNELLLIGHSEGWQQFIPLVALAILLVIFLLALINKVHPNSQLISAFLILTTLVGLLGLFFHMKGNVEFEKELYPGLSGFQLYYKAASGATPLLAPLSMSGLGLMGLLYFKLKESIITENNEN